MNSECIGNESAEYRKRVLPGGAKLREVLGGAGVENSRASQKPHEVHHEVQPDQNDYRSDQI